MDATLTKVGIQALLNAQATGTPISLSAIKISSAQIIPDGNETSLASIVHNVAAGNITKLIEGNTLIFKVHLDESIGPFVIGTFGIYTDTNILFAVCNFPGAGSKIASNLPSVLGNDKTFYLMLQYDDLSATLNTIVGDPMTTVLVKAGFPLVGVTCTARQMQLELATRTTTLATMHAAIAGLAVTNEIRITWDTGSTITKGDVTSEFIRTTLAYSSPQIDALFVAALLRTP